MVGIFEMLDLEMLDWTCTDSPKYTKKYPKPVQSKTQAQSPTLPKCLNGQAFLLFGMHACTYQATHYKKGKCKKLLKPVVEHNEIVSLQSAFTTAV